MKTSQLTTLLVLATLFAVSLAPVAASAQTPPLSAPPATLPSYTYYINGTSTHYTITTPEWNAFLNSVINNQTIVSYNWSQNATEALILFDISYLNPNPFGMELVKALSYIGSPTVENFTKAFKSIENANSLVKSGGTYMTNIQALNSGAYPGFSWSEPRVKTLSAEYWDTAIIVGIIAATFVLYFYFNRKR